MDKAEEHDIELLEPGEEAAESLQAPEQALDPLLRKGISVMI